MGDGIYIPDVIGATDVFASIPNSEIYFLGKQKGLSKSIANVGPTVVANTTLEECPKLDVMIFGASLPAYVSDTAILNFVLEQEKSAQAVISVCAGTFVIGSAGLLDGREATTNYHQIKDLKRIGACYTGKEVEEDGKFLSAGPAVGSYDVGLKAVEKIAGRDWAQYIEHQVLEFSPHPVYGTNPKNAKGSIIRTTKTISFFARKFFRPHIRKGYYGQRK
ncbi:DJ-1/PfpI family protein [bacterium SCSIO 12741]|nr:DJ-1/PfpI family protein [bacterium SCSIO 12741]